MCGKTFEAHISNRPKPHHFCSLACAASYVHQRQGHGSKVTLPCALCGAPIAIYPSRIVREHVFCNRAHFAEWRRQKVAAEKQG